MKNNSNSTNSIKRLLTLALIMIGLFAIQSGELRAQTNSAETSQSSDTRVDNGLIKACAEAVEELKAARKLIKAQGASFEKQSELLAMEKRFSADLKNLRTMDAAEKDELRKALSAKDRVIAALESEVKILKKQKFTFWKAVKVAAVAAAAGIILGKVL